MDMRPWKASGPDDFPVGFYQQAYNCIGVNVCQSIKDFWHSLAQIASFNQIDICLIPKVDKPKFVTQFRTISLCNVNYKILTKAIINRLKPLMPQIISPI